jgi:large repetitive protein
MPTYTLGTAGTSRYNNIRGVNLPPYNFGTKITVPDGKCWLITDVSIQVAGEGASTNVRGHIWTGSGSDYWEGADVAIASDTTAPVSSKNLGDPGPTKLLNNISGNNDSWYVGFGKTAGSKVNWDVEGATGTGTATGGVVHGNLTDFSPSEVKLARKIAGTFTYTEVTAPSAPVLTATGGNGEVALSWTAPANGGVAINGYTLKRGSTTLYSGTARTFTETGLANDTSYTYTVTANNNVGTSSADSASATTWNVPAAPVLTATTVSSSQIDLSWTTPATNGSALDAYVLQVSSTSATAGFDTVFSDSELPLSTTYSHTGLSKYSTYWYRVLASNGVGNSAYSTAESATTSATVPGVPTGLTATPSFTSVALNWTAPADTGGIGLNLATDYIVKRGVTTLGFTGSGTSFTDTGLSLDTSYTYTVAAVNSIGTGSYTAGVSATTLDVPSAPTVSIVRGSGSVVVTWSAGSNGRSPVIATYYRVNGGTLTEATSSPFTISGLANGTPVTITMYQTNAGGNGDIGTSNTVTPYGIPFAPTVNSITPTVNSLSVAFTPGSNNGDSITNYKYSVNGGSTFTTRSPAAATSPLVIPGLSPNTPYGVRIRAVNAAGDGTQTATTSVTTLGGRVGISDGNGNWNSVQIAKHTDTQWEAVPSVLVYISNGDDTWHLANG